MRKLTLDQVTRYWDRSLEVGLGLSLWLGHTNGDCHLDLGPIDTLELDCEFLRLRVLVYR